MVKSKKMSKTSIAVIVLALLLVLSLVMGITGAWFQDVDNSADPVSQPTLTMGQLGEVSLLATAYTWEDASHTAVSGDRLASLIVMPGDTVKAGGITINYSNAGTEAQVYYLIKAVTAGDTPTTAYYTIDNDHHLAATTTVAGTIAKGGSATTVITDCYATVNSKPVDGDGADFVSDTDENKALVFQNTLLAGNVTYTVAVLQMTNVSNEVVSERSQAYDLLVDALA